MSAKRFVILLIIYCVNASTFENVTLWISEDKITIDSSNSLKDYLPKEFLLSVIIKGKLKKLTTNSVSDIQNIQELYFHENQIEEIDKNAFINTTVKTLVINRSNLTKIDNVFDNLKVEQLQVSSNFISTISEEAFGNLPQLKRLILSNNNLSIIEDKAFDNLINLEFFDLSNNVISALPENIFKNLTNLKFLVLKNNKFCVIPNVVLDYLPIKYLDLSGNFISKLPEAAFDNLQLAGIILSRTQLTSIDKNIFNNRLFYQIELDNNEISSIDPEAFNNMTHLTNLILSGNKLKNYNTEWFKNTTKIYRLFLSSNLIENIPDEAFVNIYHKNQPLWIQLDNNRIKTITTKTFQGIEEFDYLSLANNEIKEWNDFLPNVQTIYYLNLSNNKIKCPVGDFDKIFAANFTYLGANPISEECLKQIDEWLWKNPKKIDCTKNPCFLY